MNLDPLVPLGVILLLTGWLAIPLALWTLGWCLGGLAGLLLVDALALSMTDFSPPIWLYIGAAVILGFVGAFLVRGLFTACLFVAGVFCAMNLKLHLDEVFSLSEELSKSGLGDFALTPWFTLLVALVGGALLMLLRRYLLIVLSTVVGASLLVQSLGIPEKWLTLTLVGIGFQTLCASFWHGRKG